MDDPHVLVVDDEEDILHLVKHNLARQGYEVTCVASGEEALRAARARTPDAIVLDLMLPGVSGLEVCRRLKADPKTRDAAILMLTARGEESDIVAGLESGADDYLTKPFSPRILLARLKAVLRRGATDPHDVIRGQDLSIHPGRHEVLVSEKPVDLTLTEFRMLHALARRPGWVLTRSQIVDAVQGPDVVVTDRSVDVHIVSLRRKLGPVGSRIETVRGVGYRFQDLEQSLESHPRNA